MKKIFLSLAFLAVLFCFASSLTLVSCQEKTKEKLENATDAVGTEMEQKMDTLGQKLDSLGNKIETAADTVRSKTKKVAEKVEESAKKVNDAVKK